MNKNPSFLKKHCRLFKISVILCLIVIVFNFFTTSDSFIPIDWNHFKFFFRFQQKIEIYLSIKLFIKNLVLVSTRYILDIFFIDKSKSNKHNFKYLRKEKWRKNSINRNLISNKARNLNEYRLQISISFNFVYDFLLSSSLFLKKKNLVKWTSFSFIVTCFSNNPNRIESQINQSNQVTWIIFNQTRKFK